MRKGLSIYGTVTLTVQLFLRSEICSTDFLSLKDPNSKQGHPLFLPNRLRIESKLGVLVKSLDFEGDFQISLLEFDSAQG